MPAVAPPTALLSWRVQADNGVGGPSENVGRVVAEVGLGVRYQPNGCRQSRREGQKPPLKANPALTVAAERVLKLDDERGHIFDAPEVLVPVSTIRCLPPTIGSECALAQARTGLCVTPLNPPRAGEKEPQCRLHCPPPSRLGRLHPTRSHSVELWPQGWAASRSLIPRWRR